MNPYLISLILLAGTIASIAGTIIVIKGRRQDRKNQAPVAVPLFTLNAYGQYVVAGHHFIAPPLVAFPGGWRAKHKKTIVLGLSMLAAFCSPLVFMAPAEAGLSQAMRGIFNGALKDFVDGIMGDTGGAVYGFAWMMFLAGSVLLFFFEIVKFIFKGQDPESHFLAVVWWFITFSLMTGYNSATSAIWGVAVGISNGYQEYLVGNTDNFFLAQWIHKAMAAVSAEDVGAFDTLKLISYYFSWMVAGFLLDLIASLAAMWADFGYALAKVVGFIFVPFMLLQPTRALFDAWFKFFTGFGFLLIVLKATMVVAAISVKAVVESLGVSFSGNGYGDPATVVQIGLDNLYMLGDASAMLIIAALFVLSSFAFASALAGGLGNLSGGLGTAANMAVRKILK